MSGTPTLVFADSIAAKLYAYTYDGSEGRVRDRRLFADTTELGGWPDGACADADGGVWSCVIGPGKLARYRAAGIDKVLDVPVELPADVTFGGPQLDRLYFVSIAVSIHDIEIVSPDAGGLMVIDDSGHRGQPEPRVHLERRE